MGVTDFVNSKTCGKPVHEVIREMTDGGVDFSFECTGIVDVLRESFVSTHDVCISPYSVLHFLLHKKIIPSTFREDYYAYHKRAGLCIF
jgi:hypothetical protein